jgi:hypothetical protein
VPDQFEVGVLQQMQDVVLAAGEEVVEANDVVAGFSSASQRCEPRKPAPPVTSTRFRIEYCKVFS